VGIGIGETERGIGTAETVIGGRRPSGRPGETAAGVGRAHRISTKGRSRRGIKIVSLSFVKVRSLFLGIKKDASCWSGFLGCVT